jgi:hypothetical protein
MMNNDTAEFLAAEDLLVLMGLSVPLIAGVLFFVTLIMG